MVQATFDRFAGVLVGAACADALGAGYEFGRPLPSSTPVVMKGQGSFESGEWTDDTAQLLAIALAAASGLDLGSPAGEDAVATNLQDWYLSPARLKDIGIHSAAVFGAVSTLPADGLAERFREAAEAKEARHPGRSGGNGALMRTAPVALALADDVPGMVRAAMRLGSMTHADDRSSEACAVWCLMIRTAMTWPQPWTDAEIEDLGNEVIRLVRGFLPESAEFWADALRAAQRKQPSDFFDVYPTNGYSVTTLQAAWAAISGTPVPADQPGRHLRLAVEAAVRGGGDTDTVACVAGAVLGAMWGYSAVPLEWRRQVFGWPGFRDGDLLRVADAILRGGADRIDRGSWPHADHFAENAGWPHTDSLAAHPHDDGVVLSGVDAAYGTIAIPSERIDAVVSLCRVGTHDLDHFGLLPEDHVDVRLIDQGGDANPNLELVMQDAADAVATFRAEGKRVLLHCVAAQSRTPTVAAMYSVRHFGVPAEQALRDVCDALPAASPNSALRKAVLAS